MMQLHHAWAAARWHIRGALAFRPADQGFGPCGGRSGGVQVPVTCAPRAFFTPAPVGAFYSSSCRLLSSNPGGSCPDLPAFLGTPTATALKEAVSSVLARNN